jgi:hypothetical protein
MRFSRLSSDVSEIRHELECFELIVLERLHVEVEVLCDELERRRRDAIKELIPDEMAEAFSAGFARRRLPLALEFNGEALYSEGDVG